MNDNWDILGPNFLDFNYTIPKEKHVEIARLIKEHYFGTKSIDQQSVKELIQMTSDRFFVVDGEKAARMQAKVNQNPVWFHYFNYRGEQSLSDVFSGTTVNYGKFIKYQYSKKKYIYILEVKSLINLQFIYSSFRSLPRR